MKLLFGYAKQYWKLVLVALILAAANQIYSLLDPVIFRHVIDGYATRYHHYTQPQFVRGAGLLLLIDSVYVAILVQVFAFDLKHRYILDVVMLPSWVIALALAFVTPWSPGASWPGPDWRTAVLAALIAGAVFFVLFFVGTWIFGQEAFGFGDVKLAVFIGILAWVGNLARLGRLPRTRPIVPGELAVSD